MQDRRLLAVLLLLACGAVPSLAAQDAPPPKGLEIVKNPTRRSGFWGSMGFGVGSETFSVPPGAPDPGWVASPTFNMRAGGTPDIHFRLGGELISWYNGSGEFNQSLGGLGAIAEVFPSTTVGFFLKGGGGFAWNSFSQDYYCYYYYYCVGYGYNYDTGFMWTAGAGWEIPISRTLNIMPTVDYYEFYFGSRYTGDYTERLWNFGLSIEIP